MPKSLKFVRGLLVVLAVMAAIDTLGRIGIVDEFGAAGSVPQAGGFALLAAAGGVVFLVSGGAYFLLGTPEKMNWWLALLLPVAAAVNFAIAILVIPEEHVQAWTVIDLYLFNGLLPLIVTGLLLKRPVRIYFGISQPPSRAKAA
jgi:hypothetical protein